MRSPRSHWSLSRSSRSNIDHRAVLATLSIKAGDVRPSTASPRMTDLNPYPGLTVDGSFLTDHLALTRLLSAVANLVPSHRVCFWVSSNPHSADYAEKPLAVRTSLAFVELHLFKLLPEWLEAVTKEEWAQYEERRERQRMEKMLSVSSRRVGGHSLRCNS